MTISKATRVRVGRTERKLARTAGFLASGGLATIVPPAIETPEPRVSTAARLRAESTARRLHRRTVCIAEGGVALCCPDCGGRGEQAPEMVLDGAWPPVESPCETDGCDGTVQEISLAEANARLVEGVRS